MDSCNTTQWTIWICSYKYKRLARVTDTNVSGVVNEYNFGPNVPNPKSMWNTLDFEPGAGPLAYNQQENENNFV